MSLYFNIYFFPIWLVTVLLILDLKYQCLSHICSFIVVTVLVAIIGIEVLRLYIGCMGNLTEKVPELASFWMMSLLLQVSVATISVGERKHKAVSNGA
ncbi:Transmembrane protein 17B [Blattella germanica]|nr:Transmembrane protein 17B [Blattella germanica]